MHDAAIAYDAWLEGRAGFDYPALVAVALAEYERRFPHAPNAEDAAWRRIDILRSLHRSDEMRRSAADFVSRYPGSVYAECARRLATP